MSKYIKLTEEQQRLLMTIYDDCRDEDRFVRDRQIRKWKKLKLLWDGFQRVWFSETAHDWRFDDEDKFEEQLAYDEPVNIFKAYLESIIAALSITIPGIKCYPDDAENALDLLTAKSGDKIALLLRRHNDSTLLWLRGLFITVTEGLVSCYTYDESNEEYGTYQEDSYDDVTENHQITSCPSCGYQIDDTISPTTNSSPPSSIPSGLGNPPSPNPISGTSSQPNPNQNISGLQPDEILQNEIDRFDPTDENAELHYKLNNLGTDLCPACMQMINPLIQQQELIVTKLIESKTQPKSRVKIEMYGGLHVKIPNHAKKQKDVPYLIFSEERDYSFVVNEFEDFDKDKKLYNNIKEQGEGIDLTEYDVWGRLPITYEGTIPTNVVTVHQAFIRACKFSILDSSDPNVRALKKKFPDGVKLTVVNDTYAGACNKNLDDHWTLFENPLSDHLHFEPLGSTLTSVQNITNDLISLTVQTIQHGIGQAFADPNVIDFAAYSQSEVSPGALYPIKQARGGRSLQESFYEMRTATLSAEVMPFYQQIQSVGQLVSGALPSLFGGQLEGSDTASEYSMSRAQALQRLQNTWKLFCVFWKRINGKAIPLFINCMKDDERDVQQNKKGGFFNTFIRKAETEGKIGKVELEANENLPQTWNQVKDTIEKLLMNPNPQVVAMISSPENIHQIHDAIGLIDWNIPGEEDVDAELEEIQLMLHSAPLPTPDGTTQTSSIEIDQILDNHQIRFEIDRNWLIGEQGREAKSSNPDGYHNILLHAYAHFQQIQSAQMMQSQSPVATPSGTSGIQQPNPKLNEAPITGDNNVPVTH